MSLIYKFKKEKLEDGRYVSRPKIPIILHGKDASIEVAALIDTGSDTTVIPEGIAKAIGISTEGKRNKLYAYRECNEIIESKANITFIGKVNRQSVKLNNVPISIALSKNNSEDEEDVILGVNGIFDTFNITFKKSQNRIILEKVNIINKILPI